MPLIVGPIVGILLAAGSGSRFGADKLMHRLADGTPMALAAARRLRQQCETVLAVVRPDSDKLAALLAAENIDVVVGVDSFLGMGHSLAAGVRAAPNAAAWMISLADMPFIAEVSYVSVRQALSIGASIAAPFHQGRRGHPVGFAGHWYDKLVTLKGDDGARLLLADAGEKIILCPVDDPGIVRDIDTSMDLLP